MIRKKENGRKETDLVLSVSDYIPELLQKEFTLVLSIGRAWPLVLTKKQTSE
jgi:hypothetical protein